MCNEKCIVQQLLQKMLLHYNFLCMCVSVCPIGRNALHVDVHMPSGFIYWCDFSSTVASQNGIRRIKPDGSGFRSIVTSGIGRNGIRGIAVDWAAGEGLCACCMLKSDLVTASLVTQYNCNILIETNLATSQNQWSTERNVNTNAKYFRYTGFMERYVKSLLSCGLCCSGMF